MDTIRSSGKKKAGQPTQAFWRMETIGQKLTVGFLVILILLAISGAVAYIELAKVGSNTTSMETASMQAMSASHLERLAETSLLPIHDYLLTGDPSAKAQFEKDAAELDATVADLQGKSDSTAMSGMDMGGTTGLASAALPPDQLALLDNFNQKWTVVHDGAEKIFAIAKPVGNAEAINQLKDMEAAADSMTAYAQSIHEVQMGNVSESQASANATIVSTSWFLIAAVIGAFVLGLILSRLIGNAISKPMVKLTEISSNISLGDLDTKVEVNAGGEIGELAQAIERMRTSLKIIIDRMSDHEHSAGS